MRKIRVKRCFMCWKFMGLSLGFTRFPDTTLMCGDCWDECHARELVVRENMRRRDAE